MTGLVLASLAASVPMGQQLYEEEVAKRAGKELGPSWDIRRAIIRSLRSPLPGTARVPAGVLHDGSAWSRRLAGRVIYRGADVTHRLDLRLPPAPRREVLTIHDVVPWRFPDEARLPEAVLAEAQRSEAVICPSQFSADEVTAVLGVRNVTVIHQGIDPALLDAKPMSDVDLALLGIRKPFVVHAGGCSLRKNLQGLADAWPLVRQAHPEATLAMAGPPDPRRDRLFGALSGVVRVGRVPTETLRGLMAGAAAVVVPSLYEGFGLPAIEGMAVGAPVVAAARSSLPEVCGNDAILVEPDGDGLAQGLSFALEDGPRIRELRHRGRRRVAQQTWDQTAAAHADIWRRLRR